MYEVTIYNNDTPIIVHSADSRDIKLASGVIKDGINAIESFELSMHMNNPGYGKLQPFKTRVDVYNTLTNEYEFEGRVLSPSESMDVNGLHSAAYTCEGELGYLHDSQQRQLEYRGTPKDLLETIINYHNQQVEEYKRFTVGEVTATNSTNNLYVYLSAEQKTFETIHDKLIDRIGGELQVRKENGIRYLDYLEQIGEESSTTIQLAKNLRSMSREVNPTDIITRLTPLGARIKSEDESATDASEARLTIESVNNGLPYIDRPDLIEVFGIQGGSVTWDGVNSESGLLSTATQYMNNQKVSLNQYNIDAVDLSLIGLDIDNFKTGNSHLVINPIMGLDEQLRIIGTSKDINAPQNGSLTVGDKFKSLYEYENDARKSTQAINELQERMQRLANTNVEINEKLTQAKTDLDKIQQDLIDIDVDNLPTELQGIANQITGLQSTIDGLADDITELPTYELATELVDGLLAKEDKTKLNKITVTNQIDLDELVGRIETLEGGV